MDDIAAKQKLARTFRDSTAAWWPQHPAKDGRYARDFAADAAAISVSTSATGKAFTLAIGNITAISAATTIGGHRLAGLMQTTARLVPGQSAGGPLVNLSGQVLGIDPAGSAHGTSITSYAIPMNEVLAVARQLKH